MGTEKYLNDEDVSRVQAYLSRPTHQVNRKPFRPWLLLLIIVGVMTGLSLLSYGLAYIHGLV